ncbi:peptide methionine sulfoxide reductase-like [Leishmania donovani]|uniref:peptide-methionine (S)-S-oxide reductase n=3 Tax=Leishmania donovani species complex TaxID=38574 RepID=A0A6L0WSY4_LEIIN|nr:peptide methionine sulfoxide reductase-like [Leishmania infantum JPCM5]AYU76299.1 peptide methionine sulfoxide reductase-like [Leishmania donovani]CAC9449926.1 peptide_methionine_sulfoxide_reductase-like [Leishmania infantum]TPP45336.1 Peptide methionine sulfoxide reductase family protein [Leishmania donovani]CAJ1986365.1 peptide methionine sulfoxide reductase-like [Leishmania donovani]CAM65689.1 peptide methionine sulfoxide reductase-like [Leishmania infantum JPCM5]|eukprot:XP_001463331.1 peptide methionine sulfoxide reductase-like [Leishmania infantum JPCM5]
MPAPIRATFAAGCYWGTEHFFVRNFKDSIVSHQVGFMGGVEGKAVTYPEVTKGTTGHAEVLDLMYDPEKVSYKDLLSFFFRMHNSTTLNRQAGDIGTNYRSAIFYHNEEQKKEAEAYIAKLNGADEKLHSSFSKAFGGAPCITSLEKAGTFYPAHEGHQNYLEKHPNGYCSHRLYF